MIPDSVSAGVADTRALRVSGAVVLPLFGATLFLSAFLIFLVEPMIAKMVLPVLGGTPMVWNTCVLFFQMMLLAGYAYAYGASRWIDAALPAAYVVLVAIPLTSAVRARPLDAAHDGSPIVWLLGVLLRSIGLPFFALATTASLLQNFSTDGSPRRAIRISCTRRATRQPARAAAYPTLVEPAFRWVSRRGGGRSVTRLRGAGGRCIAIAAAPATAASAARTETGAATA